MKHLSVTPSPGTFHALDVAQLLHSPNRNHPLPPKLLLTSTPLPETISLIPKAPTSPYYSSIIPGPQMRADRAPPRGMWSPHLHCCIASHPAHLLPPPPPPAPPLPPPIPPACRDVRIRDCLLKSSSLLSLYSTGVETQDVYRRCVE